MNCKCSSDPLQHSPVHTDSGMRRQTYRADGRGREGVHFQRQRSPPTTDGSTAGRPALGGMLTLFTLFCRCTALSACCCRYLTPSLSLPQPPHRPVTPPPQHPPPHTPLHPTPPPPPPPHSLERRHPTAGRIAERRRRRRRFGVGGWVRVE